jgi:hypothetical protein
MGKNRAIKFSLYFIIACFFINILAYLLYIEQGSFFHYIITMRHSTGIWFSFLAIVMISSCSKAGGYSTAQAVASDNMARYEMQMADGYATSGLAYDGFNLMRAEEEYAEVTPSSEQTRKLTKRADIRIRVEDLVTTEKPIAELMGKYNAWSASSGIYENSRNYEIRVPEGSYDAMLDELAGLGRIMWRTEYTEDVTLRYYDLEGRLATRQELLKTYQGYLTKANNIDELMTVERRIAELQREIDQTGTQFRNLSNQVEYSTINVEITGPASVGSYSRPSLGDRLAELFGSAGYVASSALVVLIGIILFGVPAVLVVVLLFWILFGRIGLLKKLWRLAAEKK